MAKDFELIHIQEEGTSPESHSTSEEGVNVPLDRINPATLRNIIIEFVTREWEDFGDSRYTLENKVEQVHQLLLEKKARVVFDLNTNSCNIITCEGKHHV